MSIASTVSSTLGKLIHVGKIHDHSRSYQDDISLRVEGDDLQSHDPNHPTEKDFKFYTMDLSYFSGKLEM
jgi:hypothetical protein